MGKLQQRVYVGWDRDGDVKDCGFHFNDGFLLEGVQFNIEEMPGQCGAAVLCEFDFTEEGDKGTPEAFIKGIREAAKGHVALLVASAVVGTPLHHFLDRYPWCKGSAVKNPNSGNIVQIFELKV